MEEKTIRDYLNEVKGSKVNEEDLAGSSLNDPDQWLRVEMLASIGAVKQAANSIKRQTFAFFGPTRRVGTWELQTLDAVLGSFPSSCSLSWNLYC